MTNQRRPWWLTMSTVLLAGAMLAAACGGDDDDAADPTTTVAPDATDAPVDGATDPTTTVTPDGTDPTTTVAPDATDAPPDGTDPTTTVAPDATDAPPDGGAVEGCEQAETDLAVEASVPRARCEPGAPAAQPLAERTTLQVGVSSTSAEFFTAVALGLQKGEFEAENLDLKIQVLPPADLLQLLAEGGLDLVVGSSSAALFNAVDQGFDIAWTIGLGHNHPDSGAGFWARGSDVEVTDLRGLKVGSAVGAGSSANLALVQQMPDDMSITDLQFETMDVADVATALQNGAVDAAVLLDPFWLPFKDDPNYTFLAPVIPHGANVAGVLFGPSLQERREPAVAFTRAYIRTVNTYLDGDYKADQQLLADLSEALDVPADRLAQTPSFVWDWDIQRGMADELQDLFLEAGVATYQEPVTEEQIIDRSFVGEAVGIPRG